MESPTSPSRQRSAGPAGPRATDAECQLEALSACLSEAHPPCVEPWLWRGQRLLRKAFRRLARLLRAAAPSRRAVVPAPFAAAPLVAGDRVRVRILEEVRSTLDAESRLHGCSFLPGMTPHCGREYRVLRVVTRFFDEARWRMTKTRNLVLLEGVHCDGSSLPETAHCDRMCFYFWRNEWLEKVGAPAAGARPLPRDASAPVSEPRAPPGPQGSS